MEHLFLRRTEKHYQAWFCRLVAHMFAITQHWRSGTDGASRGRLFEAVLHRYCEVRRLPVTERPGSRTIRHEPSASGFHPESDAVLSFPDMTVHLELKHLSVPLGKNELLIFNQKELDHLYCCRFWVKESGRVVPARRHRTVFRHEPPAFVYGAFHQNCEFIGICSSGPTGTGVDTPAALFRSRLIALLTNFRQAQQRLSHWVKQSAERSALFLHRFAAFF